MIPNLIHKEMKVSKSKQKTMIESLKKNIFVWKEVKDKRSPK